METYDPTVNILISLDTPAMTDDLRNALDAFTVAHQCDSRSDALWFMLSKLSDVPPTSKKHVRPQSDDT